MFETEITMNRFLLGYMKMLLGDVEDGQFAVQPVPGANPPAWILGHLALTSDGAVGMFGGEKKLGPEWEKLYGRGSVLSTHRADYPSKDELLSTLEERSAKWQQLAAVATAEFAASPNVIEQLRERLPTMADLASFLMVGHFGVHLGQLSSWRRMQGKPALF